jgi:hypothetical protein
MYLFKWFTTIGAIALMVFSYYFKMLAQRKWKKRNDNGMCAKCEQLLIVQVNQFPDDKFVICRNCAQEQSESTDYGRYFNTILLVLLVIVCFRILYGTSLEWEDFLGIIIVLGGFLSVYLTYAGGPGKEHCISEIDYHSVEREQKKAATWDIEPNT